MRTFTVLAAAGLPPSCTALLWLTMVPRRLEACDPTPWARSTGWDGLVDDEGDPWANDARARMLMAWLMSMLYVPSERWGEALTGVEGAEFEGFWKEMERVAVGVMAVAVDFGTSAGEAATATLTSVSNAALLLTVCGGREAIMDLSEELLALVPPLVEAAVSLRRE